MRLRFESIDDEAEEKDFADLEQAIAYSVKWFLDGYDNKTISDDDRARAKESADAIGPRLRKDGVFHCGNFHEHIAVLTTTASALPINKPTRAPQGKAR